MGRARILNGFDLRRALAGSGGCGRRPAARNPSESDYRGRRLSPSQVSASAPGEFNCNHRGKPAVAASVAVIPGIPSLAENEKGPLLRATLKSSQDLFLLLHRSGFFAAPEFVDQHRAHRVNIEVAIEFDASAIALILFEREFPVVVVQPREPILTA
jgi:hypothetical protein